MVTTMKRHNFNDVFGKDTLFGVGTALSELTSGESNLAAFRNDLNRYVALLPVERSTLLNRANISVITGWSANNQYLKTLILNKKFYPHAVVADVNKIGMYILTHYTPMHSKEQEVPTDKVLVALREIAESELFAGSANVPTCNICVMPEVYSGEGLTEVYLLPHDGKKGKIPLYNIFVHAPWNGFNATQLKKSIASALAICYLDAYVKMNGSAWAEMCDTLKSAYDQMKIEEYETCAYAVSSLVNKFYKAYGYKYAPYYMPIATLLTGELLGMNERAQELTFNACGLLQY